jgi:hypothetical protein
MAYVVKDNYLEASGNWLVYSWDACKKFGAEFYHTWRLELSTSLLIALAAYAITVYDEPQAWKNFMVTIEASALVLEKRAHWY